MIRRTAIGCTVGHDYSFFLPIVAYAWRDRIGYEPSFFLVGTREEWEAHKYAHRPLSALMQGGFHVEFVDHIEGVEDATISQCVRQHAAAHDFPADDLLICSDADLIPIRREFYYTHDADRFQVGLYYSNGYQGEVNHFPSCHMSMRVRDWREVMGLDVGLAEAMKRNFAEYGLAEAMAAKRADPAKAWGRPWFADELIASKKIVESGKSLQMIEREGHPPCDRLDRAYWPEKYDAASLTDCHSLRPGWSDPKWPRLRPLLEQILPERMGFFDAYRAHFRELMGVGK